MNALVKEAAAGRAVESIPVLDAAECAAIEAKLRELRSAWTQRHPLLPFYTLGAASYIDAAASREAYAAKAAAENPILDAHFGPMLARVREALAEALGGPVEWHPTAARPGFHIYLAHKVFEQPIASVHLDSQYDLVDWSACGGQRDFDDARSFTLSIALPRNGGGLRVWNLHRKELAGLDNVAIGARMQGVPFEYHAYSVGSMAIHSGDVLHQAAPGRDISGDDRRITLQGHCLRVDGTWRVYW